MPNVPRQGLFDDQAWPTTLTARVVTPGERPRVHGYDVEADLARHYRFTDLALLALTGELPSNERSALFDLALIFAGPVAVNEAPTHVAVLSRLCGGDAAAVTATAATALAEQARFAVGHSYTWIAWLSAGASGVDLPAEARARDDSDRDAVRRLKQAVESIGATVPGLAIELDLGRDAAVVACLHACGLRQADQIERALVLARLTLAVAEGMAVRPGDFASYPANLPAVEYVEASE